LLPKTDNAEFQKILTAGQAMLYCGGHTHTQQIRRLSDASWYINPGSVGVAYNWLLTIEQFHLDSWAEYAIATIEDDRFQLEFVQLSLDTDALIKTIEASKRPYKETSIAYYRQKKKQ
jgi:predicted phosphodiesterase